MSATPKQGKSKCRTCGERILETGNYHVKIIKSKRVPVKALKLAKAGKLDESRKDALKQTKFGRFLLKRLERENAIEITCDNCRSSSQIKTKKPQNQLEELGASTPHPSSVAASGESSSKKRKKRKGAKELNAGLLIPSRDESGESRVLEPGSSTSTYEFRSDHTPKPAPSKSKPVVNKEKEMENLKKALFRNKKKAGKGPAKGTSLKDFLSSM